MSREIDGVNILFVLRERIASDWESLCREFGASGHPGDTNALKLHDKLKYLRELGLLEFEGDARRTNDVRGPVRITERWTRTHKMLGGQKLEDLVKLNSGGIVVNPIWERPPRVTKKSELFVLMPFTDKLRPVYTDHITKVANDLGLSVGRADDVFTTHGVMSDIWSGICDARALIADCTGRNPNVFYEMGIAHVIGKPLVLITQKREDIPFDIAHLRHIRYENTAAGMEVFEERLRNTLKEILQLEEQQSTP